MAVTQLTQTNLDDTINNNDIVLIDFWAPWCGPCQTFKPIFEKASKKHEDAVFASCNTEEQSELAAMFQIQSIPTLVVFREGIGIFGQPGMLPSEAPFGGPRRPHGQGAGARHGRGARRGRKAAGGRSPRRRVKKTQS